MTRVCVLTYHTISRNPSVLSVSPENFRAHVEEVVRSKRDVIPASRLASPFRDEPAVRDGSVVFTFDDGFASVAAEAAPVLRSHGFPYALFLVTSWVGRTNDWPSQPAGIPREPLMGWHKIEQLAADGAEIGAHTASHPDLRRLSAVRIEEEIRGSREEIERRLGITPHLFAYPAGRLDGRVKRIAEALFPACFGTRHERMQDTDARGEIPRVETYYFRSARRFRGLFGPVLDVKLAGRRLARRVRSFLEG